MNHKSSTNSHLKGCWELEKKRPTIPSNISQKHLWKIYKVMIYGQYNRKETCIGFKWQRGRWGWLTTHTMPQRLYDSTRHTIGSPCYKMWDTSMQQSYPYSLSLSLCSPSLPPSYSLFLSVTVSFPLPLTHKDLSERAWKDLTEWTFTPGQLMTCGGQLCNWDFLHIFTQRQVRNLSWKDIYFSP